MDKILLEEHLREAAAVGDIKSVQELIKLGVDINSRNRINGWTALHWACKRNFADIVLLLIQNGADKNILTSNGEDAVSLCCLSSRILQILGEPVIDARTTFLPKEEITFVPNYLKNPPLNISPEVHRFKTPSNSSSSSNHVDEKNLILKIREADSSDPDFIEIEITRNSATYESLVKKCIEELCIKENGIIKIRKLPNTKIRNDKDVQRLTDFQEIEVVTDETNISKSNGVAVSVTPSNSYQSISKKDQTILY